MEPRDRTVRSRLEAHRHFVAISGQQAVSAILPSVRKELLPRDGSASRKVRRRDVLYPLTEQVLGFIAEDGLDPTPNRDVPMVVVSHEHE